jgi:hypothetical protein
MRMLKLAIPREVVNDGNLLLSSLGLWLKPDFVSLRTSLPFVGLLVQV